MEGVYGGKLPDTVGWTHIHNHAYTWKPTALTVPADIYVLRLYELNTKSPVKKGYRGRNICNWIRKKKVEIHIPKRMHVSNCRSPAGCWQSFWIKLIYSYGKHIWFTQLGPRDTRSWTAGEYKIKLVNYTSSYLRPMLNWRITIDFIDIYQGTWTKEQRRTHQ